MIYQGFFYWSKKCKTNIYINVFLYICDIYTQTHTHSPTHTHTFAYTHLHTSRNSTHVLALCILWSLRRDRVSDEFKCTPRIRWGECLSLSREIREKLVKRGLLILKTKSSTTTNQYYHHYQPVLPSLLTSTTITTNQYYHHYQPVLPPLLTSTTITTN